MINDRCREVVNDSVQALHALAKLMPLLTSQSSLAGMLETINHALGSTLAWISMDDDAGMQRVICAGNLSCHSFDITHFLASTLLQRQHRSWRSIYWKENVGKVLLPLHIPATNTYRVASYVSLQTGKERVMAISSWDFHNGSYQCRP